MYIVAEYNKLLFLSADKEIEVLFRNRVPYKIFITKDGKCISYAQFAKEQPDIRIPPSQFLKMIGECLMAYASENHDPAFTNAKVSKKIRAFQSFAIAVEHDSNTVTIHYYKYPDGKEETARHHLYYTNTGRCNEIDTILFYKKKKTTRAIHTRIHQRKIDRVARWIYWNLGNRVAVDRIKGRKY